MDTCFCDEEKALQYMEEMEQEDNPWYLSVHHTAPHSSWNKEQHPQKYIDMYKERPFDSVPDVPSHPNQIPTCPQGTGEGSF